MGWWSGDAADVTPVVGVQGVCVVLATDHVRLTMTPDNARRLAKGIVRMADNIEPQADTKEGC